MDQQGVADHIAAWMKRYATESRTRGFVVGVSGGVDSALTSTLAAMTGMPTLCVEMPIHQHHKQVQRALDHVEWLRGRYPNVSLQRVELTGIFDAFVHAIGMNEHPQREMALVNARARLRMTTLYYYAGLHNLLVAGTGNKIEDFGIGFFTKYGDGGVDLSPIADLTKTEVFALSQHLGVAESILSAPPTDGLWGDNRTDADQIGATYPELEWAMDFKGSENALTVRQQEILAIYRRRNLQNQHKMVPIPVCVIPENLK
jgi:NAD+ synthase